MPGLSLIHAHKQTQKFQTGRFKGHSLVWQAFQDAPGGPKYHIRMIDKEGNRLICFQNKEGKGVDILVYSDKKESLKAYSHFCFKFKNHKMKAKKDRKR